MKVIEFLNKMAKEQNYRPDFIFKSTKYEFQKEYGDYKNNWNNKWGIFTGWCINMILNDEIEIIEEEKKPIEKLFDNSANYNFSKTQNGMTKEDRRLLDSNFIELGNKINEIIDKLNKLEEESKK